MSSGHYEHRSERPFKGLYDIGLFFDQLALDISGENESIHLATEGKCVLSEEAFNDSIFTLKLSEDKKSFEKVAKRVIESVENMGIPKEDVELSISFRLKYLNLIEQSKSVDMNSLLTLNHELVVVSPAERHPLTTSVVQGFEIIVQLLLVKQQVERKTLTPYYPGTILGEGTVEVRTDKSHSSFSIEPLTAERRVALGNLSKDTLTFIEMGGVNPINPGDSEKDITLYLDEKILKKLNEMAKNKSGLYMQRKLALDVQNTMIMHAHRFINENDAITEYEDIKESIIGNYFETLSRERNGRVDKNSIRRLIKNLKDKPELVKAEFESLISENSVYSLQKNMLDLLTEEEEE